MEVANITLKEDIKKGAHKSTDPQDYNIIYPLKYQGGKRMTKRSRIRELRRKILHERNPIIRGIYKDHIKYLMEE